MVEAGGVEVSRGIENRQVTDFRLRLIPLMPAIPLRLARFGTVTLRNPVWCPGPTHRSQLPRVRISLDLGPEAGGTQVRVVQRWVGSTGIFAPRS